MFYVPFYATLAIVTIFFVIFSIVKEVKKVRCNNNYSLHPKRVEGIVILYLHFLFLKRIRDALQGKIELSNATKVLSILINNRENSFVMHDAFGTTLLVKSIGAVRVQLVRRAYSILSKDTT